MSGVAGMYFGWLGHFGPRGRAHQSTMFAGGATLWSVVLYCLFNMYTHLLVGLIPAPKNRSAYSLAAFAWKIKIPRPEFCRSVEIQQFVSAHNTLGKESMGLVIVAPSRY